MHWLAKALDLFVRSPGLVFHSDPVRYYEYLGEDVVEGEHYSASDASDPRWLNLGYWRSARTYPEAAAALSLLLADAAELGSSDEVLDVGFGFAEQDFLWLERYGVKRISGLNISAKQVEKAKRRALERGLSERLDLEVGSATRMPFADGSFDKVTALECSHHFQTRESFFKEAFRVLRPGGRLALSDGLPGPRQASPGLIVRMTLRRWAYPFRNFYGIAEYTQKLRDAGFIDVRYESIGEHVFPWLTRYADQRRAGASLYEPVPEPEPDQAQQAMKMWQTLGIGAYVIVTADKPRLEAR